MISYFTLINTDITEEWITMQIKTGLASIGEDKIRKMIIAYEPIWAIGTGKTATPEQAEEVCEHIRAVIRKLYGAKVARAISILYGGSMNEKNAQVLPQGIYVRDYELSSYLQESYL